MQHVVLFVLALAFTTDVTSGHEHDRQHSHFCLGGGYSLLCGVGYTLRLDKAWFGRIAADPEACMPNTTTTTNHSSPAPLLTKDCGTSLLAEKDTWCRSVGEGGGCTIAVTADMAPGPEEKPCPADVIKYLYLEYECLSSGFARLQVSFPVWVVLFGLILLQKFD